MTPWTDRVRALADELERSGDMRSPEWRRALCVVPRHELVPVFYRQYTLEEITELQHQSQSPDLAELFRWRRIDSAEPATRQQWWEAIYSNQTLVTVLADEPGPHGVQQVAVSSSTLPGLMIRMLEDLDVHDGHRVLEIGTGTGYNAALLSARLGDDRVFSVDVEASLIDCARGRLAAIGYRPTLVAVDGVRGLPEHAPYDRIITTASTPAVPWTWVEQVADGGLLLVDLKPAVNAGNLVLLRRTDNRAEGRFLGHWAGFMAMRQVNSTPVEPPGSVRDRRSDATTRSTDLTAVPWDNTVVWFLASLRLPAHLGYGHVINPESDDVEGVFLQTPDGSWCEVRHGSYGHGTVTEGGPCRLWRTVEAAYRLWHELDRPCWERFGLTVTRTEQRVWLDRADGVHNWLLEHDLADAAVSPPDAMKEQGLRSSWSTG